MININTILSVFDERGTLLKWLKDVEKTINNDSLKVIELIETDAYNFKLKFVFGDDSVIYTPLITIPKTTATSLLNLMEGNDTIIIDLDEATNKVELHIDNNLLNKINSSLQLPSVAPTELMAVCVDTNNTQTLKAVSDLGNKLYMHTIKLSNPVANMQLKIINNCNESIAREDLGTQWGTNGVSFYMSPRFISGGAVCNIFSIETITFNSSSNSFELYVGNVKFENSTFNVYSAPVTISSMGLSYKDTVTEL